MPAMRLAFDHIVASAVRPSIAAAMVIAASVTGNCLQFSALADLRREMSTKSNNNAATAGTRGHIGGGMLASDNRLLQRARMELAYFSGFARLKQRRTGGAGIVLRFERVRPRRSVRFQPLKSREITPEFLDRTIRALKRWKFDIVAMDEVCRRRSE